MAMVSTAVPRTSVAMRFSQVPTAWIWLVLCMFVTLSARPASLRAEEPIARETLKIKVRYNIPYGDGTKSDACLADVYQPVPAGQYPGIVMIHGGAWVAGDKANDALHARKIAAAGYVVMVINYRLAPAHKYPAQIDDCFAAVRWLVDHSEDYGVDGDRIGVWGYSAGGHLAALVATDPRAGIPRVKACVAGGAPCDLRLIPSDSSILSAFLGGTRDELPDVYVSASPVEHVSKDDPPMLIFHGQSDNLVPIEFVDRMQRRLTEEQVAFEFLALRNKSHIMAFVDPEATRRSIAFFDLHLKSQSPVDPSLGTTSSNEVLESSLTEPPSRSP